jgi:hypothetical protein
VRESKRESKSEREKGILLPYIEIKQWAISTCGSQQQIL